MHEQFTAELRASGRLIETSDDAISEEYTVTFPWGRPPQVSGHGPAASPKRGQVEFPETLPVLANSRHFRDELAKVIGMKPAEDAMELIRTGQFDAAPMDYMEDLLADAIGNCDDIVWSGVIRGNDDVYPVQVKVYEGVFAAWVMEFGLTTYFLSMEDAKDYITDNHEGVEED